MNVAETKIRDEAKVNGLDVDDLGSLVVAMLHENFDVPIGSLIFRNMIKEDSDKLDEVATEIAELFLEEYEREDEKRNEKKNS